MTAELMTGLGLGLIVGMFFGFWTQERGDRNDLAKIPHAYEDDGRTRRCAARCGGYRSAHIDGHDVPVSDAGTMGP